MARRYDVVARPRPRISVGWTVATCLFSLALVRGIYPPLAVAVVVFGVLWALGVTAVRGYNRSATQRPGEDRWGRPT